MNNPVTLPFTLQYLVAVASIISASAVIVYIIQAFITVRQFKKQQLVIKTQIELSEKQFKEQIKISDKQFHYVNQGWLSFDFIGYLTVPDAKSGTPMHPDVKCYGITFKSTLENTGNSPIVVQFKYLELFFSGVSHYKYPNKENGVEQYPDLTLYPKQSIPHNYGNINFSTDGKLITIRELSKFEIIVRVILEYQDINSSNLKIIDRTATVLIRDVNISTMFIKINDSVQT